MGEEGGQEPGSLAKEKGRETAVSRVVPQFRVAFQKDRFGRPVEAGLEGGTLKA